MATPGQTRSWRGHKTLSTRLPMVSMSRASESLVGAWVIRVRGRLFLLMMARPQSSKACSIGSISRKQVGHGTTTGSYASRICFCTAAAIYRYVGKRSRLAAECCFHKFFLGVEGRGFPECPAYKKAVTFPSGATNDICPPLWIPTHPHPHIEPVLEYSNVGGSHHLIAGQSVFHLYDQRCSALSSWRQHIASVRPATFYGP